MIFSFAGLGLGLVAFELRLALVILSFVELRLGLVAKGLALGLRIVKVATVPTLVFTQSNMRNQFNFFEFKFGKNIKFFELRFTKIPSLLFDLITFFLLTCCFFEFGKTTDFFEFKLEFAALVQNRVLLFFTVSSQN